MKNKSLYQKGLFWIIGFFAFLWFIFRTGTNPRRLTYPCQQAAFPIASAFVIALVSLFSGIVVIKLLKKYSLFFLCAILLSFIGLSFLNNSQTAKVLGKLPVWQVNNPTSTVFLMDTVYNTAGSLAAGDNSVPLKNFDDPTMDSLFVICSAHGLFLYKNSSHPDGIVGKNDVVIIKPNFQWQYRLGTNTDRIKGLMNLILKHPDGFTGEILICDNTQELSDITEEACNSDDVNQSILDVVKAFQAKGYPVYLYKWRDIRSNHVKEYSANDYNEGYIIQKDKVTYPKFKSPSGKYNISLRYGIWDSVSKKYDPDRLTIINFPVLKAHCMAGATVGIKNWVGVLTTAFTDSLYGGWDPMHYNYFWSNYALIARVMAVTAPKLTIVDASYTATRTNWEQPPANNTVIKTNKVVASRDPLAASWYSAKYILTPIADFPAYTNPDNLDKSDSMHTFGCIVRRWAKFLIDSAHLAYTLDSAKISVFNSTRNNNTGVSKLKPDLKWMVYPNPNSGQFLFKVLMNSNTAKVAITSANGAQVLSQTVPLNNGQGRLNLKLKKGIYIIKVQVGNQQFSSQLVIKD